MQKNKSKKTLIYSLLALIIVTIYFFIIVDIGITNGVPIPSILITAFKKITIIAAIIVFGKFAYDLAIKL